MCGSACVYVHVCVCVEDVHEKREKKVKREGKEKESREEKRKENINLFIQINRQ